MDKSVTISCRVTPEVKMRLAQRSEKLGMKLCNYIELLVLAQLEMEQKSYSESTGENQNPHENGENEKLIEPTFHALFSYQTSESIPANIFEEYMDILQEKYKDATKSEIVNACIIHAVKNDNAFWQRNLSVFLNRLKNGEYDN